MLLRIHSNSVLHIFLRTFSSLNSLQEPLPVIKVPKYLKTTLNKIRFNEQKKVDNFKKEEKRRENSSEESLKLDKSICIISSNNKKFNHHFGQTYNQRNPIPLISKEWTNGPKTYGSKMCFHIYGTNPSKIVSDLSEDSVPTFESLGLTTNMCDAIHYMSISEPTAIQSAVIPSILENKNIILSSETGSGKTIAYLAPIIQMIREYKELKGEQTSTHFPKCLVTVPSRELAEQVGRVAQYLGSYCGVGVATMIGGIPKHLTHSGMDLIVSTIGLVQPLIAKRVYSLKQLNHLVIDESDTLFDQSFNCEVLDLLSQLLVRDNVEEEEESDESEQEADPKSMAGIQLVCVSATMPRSLKKTLGTVVDIDNNFERISTNSLHHILPHIRQDFYRIDRFERSSKLLELVLKDQRMGRPVMIFSNRSDSSNWIYHYLNDNGIQCLRLNTDIPEEERYDQLKRFQSGESNVISCTDLGSRGLDTVRVRHVINYDCPHYVTDYIHRSGRTGRMGVNGNCLVSTLVSFKPDVLMVQHLELALRLNRPIESIDDSFRNHFKQNQNKTQIKRKK